MMRLNLTRSDFQDLAEGATINTITADGVELIVSVEIGPRKEIMASDLKHGDRFLELGMEPQIVWWRGDWGDTVLITTLSDVEMALGGDTVVILNPSEEDE